MFYFNLYFLLIRTAVLPPLLAQSIHSIAFPPRIVKSNPNRVKIVLKTDNPDPSPFQVNQNIVQGFENNGGQSYTYTVNHNENPAELTLSKSEVFFVKYETQQEADKYCKFKNNIY